MDSNEFKQRLAQSGMSRDQAAVSLGVSKSYVDSVCTNRRPCTSEMACVVQLWPTDGSLVQQIEPFVQKPEDEVAEVVQSVVQSGVVYKSDSGPEWDIMDDGFARGFPGAPPSVRIEALTAYAYFRIIQQETGFNVMANRVTREEFDKVDWKKLSLPNFDTVGMRIRARLGK